MKCFLNQRLMIVATFILCLLTLPSCSEDSELLPPSENIIESISDPINTEQTEDTEDTPPNPITQDSIVNDTLIESGNKLNAETKLSINGNQFYINGVPTYEGRYWNGNKIEGLLMNSRMVQGIFDDTNPATKQLFAYPDTNTWSADRNTDEFITAMADWKKNGLLAFTLNLQGGSPTGYGNAQAWVNSAFDKKGALKPAYLSRLKRVLDAADNLGMVVILGYFYFGQDEILENEEAVVNATDNITNWLLDMGYKNLLIEINNECDIPYDHSILGPNRVHELINRVKQTEKNGFRLLVSTSYRGTVVPKENVVMASDYILLHGNGVGRPSQLLEMITDTRNVNGSENKPIIINEDDHFDFDASDNNFLSAIQGYASWGYFDYRKSGEGYENGYQSVPVDWGINSARKQSFFSKLKEVTGY